MGPKPHLLPKKHTVSMDYLVWPKVPKSTETFLPGKILQWLRGYLPGTRQEPNLSLGKVNPLLNCCITEHLDFPNPWEQKYQKFHNIHKIHNIYSYLACALHREEKCLSLRSLSHRCLLREDGVNIYWRLKASGIRASSNRNGFDDDKPCEMGRKHLREWSEKESGIRI